MLTVPSSTDLELHGLLGTHSFSTARLIAAGAFAKAKFRGKDSNCQLLDSPWGRWHVVKQICSASRIAIYNTIACYNGKMAAATTTTTTLRPLVRARFWLHSSQCKRAKMCIFIHWQQCFHASCARSKCIVKNNVSWWRLLVMIAFLFKFFWKNVQNSKNAWVFWKNVLRIGFSHANATSHFQWSWVSYVICNKKCTLQTSVFWEVLASFFWRMWNLWFLNKNRHDAQGTLEYGEGPKGSLNTRKSPSGDSGPKCEFLNLTSTVITIQTMCAIDSYTLYWY